MAESIDTRAEQTVVDPTLLATLRALSPEERLRWNDRAAATVLELRHAFTAAKAGVDDAARPAGRQRR